MYSQRPLITYTLTWLERGQPRVRQSKSFTELLGIALDAGVYARPIIVDEKGEIKFPQPDRPNSGVVPVVISVDPALPNVVIYEPLKTLAA